MYFVTFSHRHSPTKFFLHNQRNPDKTEGGSLCAFLKQPNMIKKLQCSHLLNPAALLSTPSVRSDPASPGSLPNSWSKILGIWNTFRTLQHPHILPYSFIYIPPTCPYSSGPQKLLTAGSKHRLKGPR